MLKYDSVSDGFFLCLLLTGKYGPASKDHAVTSEEKQRERQNKTCTKLPPQAEILVR